MTLLRLKLSAMSFLSYHVGSILNKVFIKGFFLVFILALSSNSSVTGNSNYHPYLYDQTHAQFTPDGRLLQVEYASLAATHSAPCLIWRISGQEITLVMTPKFSSSPLSQNRLISLHDSDVVLCLSGVLSDSLALLRKVQEVQNEFFELYGAKTFSVATAAQAIAQQCVNPAIGGGIRPYGSTIVLCDPSGNIIQTDPSGSILTIDKDVHIVGGKGSIKFPHYDTSISLAEALEKGAACLLKAIDSTDKTDFWLEAIVLSKEKGIYRLSDSQIGTLLKRIQAKTK